MAPNGRGEPMRPGDLQSERARAPRPAARGVGSRGAFGQRSSGKVVAPEVVESDGFTWERVSAFQCVADEEYTLPESCVERDYLTKAAARIVQAIGGAADLPKSTLLQKFAAAIDPDDTLADDLQETFILRSVKYAQLNKRFIAPDLSLRDPPANQPDYVPATTFEMFNVNVVDGSKQVVKRFVQAPECLGGWYAELTGDRSLKFKPRFEFEVKIANDEDIGLGNDTGVNAGVTYLIRLECGQRTKSNVYLPGQSHHEVCIKMQLGHFDDSLGCFEPSGVGLNGSNDIMFADKDLMDRMFEQNKWPLHERNTDGVEEAVEESGPASKSRYCFETVNDRLCNVVSRKGGSSGSNNLARGEDDSGTEAIELANFCIPGIIQSYQFSEAGHAPMFKVLCRHHLDNSPDDGHTVYIKAEDEVRAPDLTGAKFLEVEVIVHDTLIKTQQELKNAFAKVHRKLCVSSMTVEHFSCYLTSIDNPNPSSVIVRWGLQPDGWWVFHNAAFRNGEVVSVEESGHGIVPSFFHDNAICAMETHDFPRLIHVPMAHVRYTIGEAMWNKVIPPFFANNEMATKALFSGAVLGMHCQANWSGQSGLGHGHPIIWAHSPEQGTGKSESFSLANSLVGLFGRAIWGGDSTKSMNFEGLSLDSGLTKFVDDCVFTDKGRGLECKVMKQQVRGFYDRTARAVTGKVRRPYSSVAFASNSTVNDDDKAFQSRLLTIPFKELRVDGNDDDPTLYDTFQGLRKLISCLAPDLQMIGLWNGKLDKQAIQDWSRFLQRALGKKRDRNVNEWAKLAHIFSLLNALFQCGSAEQCTLFEWMIVTVTRQTHELVNHSGVLDQFILSVLDIKENIDPNLLGPNPEKVLFWHNFRTNAVPLLHSSGHGSPKYWAFRLGKVCNVIKKLTGKTLKETDVKRAAIESDHAVASDGMKAYFYDISIGAWPIKKTISVESEYVTIDVPLPEDELDNMSLRMEYAIFIKLDYINQIVTGLQKTAIDVDYKSIEINSANPEVGTYNFFHAVTQGGWFGYRSLKQCSLRQFCGGTNLMFCDGPVTDLRWSADVQEECTRLGEGWLEDYFNPDVLLDWFNYEMPTPLELKSFPVAYRRIPFEFSNREGDEHVCDEMRDDPPELDEYRGSYRRLDDDGDDDELPPPKRRRASPSNLTRYPRPPHRVHDPHTAKQWTDYKRAITGNGSGIVLSEAEASDEDEEKEGEEERTAEDNAFIDDSEPDANHSQGEPLPMNRCINVLFIDDETGEETTCGDECAPHAQMCHFCESQVLSICRF